ncbi:uncharacterized protein LOC127810288 [Diospyros lotus]|uniref:uncharacterized protein LOC127810288 n=1 Tax=Diospyros lotus TaxID=55363 RepID=UPI0022569A6E|nr:uncharacterized protein LOC127810288 [Diospyros lotus]
MGHEDGGGKGWRAGYKKLTSSDGKMARPRRPWLRKVNGKFTGFRLARSRKLNWKAVSLVSLPRVKIAEMYANALNRMKMDDICPAIIFSGQWGLPVLSHSNTAKCRSTANVSLHRNPSLL